MGLSIEESSKDDRYFINRIKELSSAAYSRNMITFSDFLDQRQITLLKKETGRLDTPFSLYGGYDEADRSVAAFMGRDLYEGENIRYPVSFIMINPEGAGKKALSIGSLSGLNQRTDEKNENTKDRIKADFGHRDILGTVLGLGIERRMVGDIITRPFYGLFCLEQISEFIVNNLTRIRHTGVECYKLDISDFHYEPVFEERNISVSSNRLDALVAAACRISRSESEKLFQKENVFVNSSISTKTFSLTEGDVVSVRGIGKFKLIAWNGESKKGRLRALINWYC